MDILYYTIAVGEHNEALANLMPRIVPVTMLNGKDLGASVLDDVLAHTRHKSRIREFVNIDKYDAVVALESDVAVWDISEFTGDEIKVERGDKTLKKISDEMGDRGGNFEAPDVIAPWNGIVYVPRAQYAFFDDWEREYAKLLVSHRSEELTLWNALQPYCWKFLETTAFWPRGAGIVHYRGLDAKRSIMPDYTERYADAALAASSNQNL